MKLITFPDNEKEDIKNRIKSGKNVFTIRVAQDYGRFQKDILVQTEWGEILIVENVTKADNFEELEKKYPYFNELDEETINLLKQHNKFDILELKKLG